jgi:hypothetical protein
MSIAIPTRLRGPGLLVIAAVSCGGGGAHTATHEPCATSTAGAELVRALSEPVTLELLVMNGLLWEGSCDGKAPRVVRVGIDRKPWCEVAVTCSRVISAAFACKGPPIAAGAHVVQVELADAPSSLMLRTMSLPAFDKTKDGHFVFGAHVAVWVRDQGILIDPPTATAEAMF